VNYDPYSEICSGVCGHYTQVVWEKSVRVGCGMAECSNLEGASFGGSFVICQYYPGGNYPTKPYKYAISRVGEDCHAGVYGRSTGSDTEWIGLCNNGNELCGKENRCLSHETCVAGTVLNGFDTSYECVFDSTPVEIPSATPVQTLIDPIELHSTLSQTPPSGCYFTLIAYDYEIDGVSHYKNGMTDNGAWKWCYNDEYECVLWCYNHQNEGCLGVTSDVTKNVGYYFPVTSIDESEREWASGGSITMMECEEVETPSPSSVILITCTWELSLCCMLEESLKDTIVAVASSLGVDESAVSLSSQKNTGSRSRFAESNSAWNLTYEIVVESTESADVVRKLIESEDTLNYLRHKIEHAVSVSQIDIVKTVVAVRNTKDTMKKPWVWLLVTLGVLLFLILLVVSGKLCMTKRNYMQVNREGDGEEVEASRKKTAKMEREVEGGLKRGIVV